jgi:hypothetical protein
VTTDQKNAADEKLAATVLDFLKSHAPDAYSVSKIVAEVEGLEVKHWGKVMAACSQDVKDGTLVIAREHPRSFAWKDGTSKPRMQPISGKKITERKAAREPKPTARPPT